jgi:hypothetical protein
MEKFFSFLDLPIHQLKDYQKLNSGSYSNIPPSIYPILRIILNPIIKNWKNI